MSESDSEVFSDPDSDSVCSPHFI